MTEKSAEAPRTPEERAEHVLWEVRNDPDVEAHPEATARECIIRGIRAALAARDAAWREAVRDTGMEDWLHDDCERKCCAGLRALLSEAGKPGQ